MSNFKILTHEIGEIERKKIPVYKSHMKKPAEEYHNYIVDWLQDMKWPLRKGLIGPRSRESRIDPIRGTTPTERLWGETNLADNQKMEIIENSGGFHITFSNEADHAKYFFPKIEPHPIPAEEGKKLVYWVGDSLPWMPVMKQGVALPLREKGYRESVAVDHPGHMDYHQILVKAYDEEFKPDFDKAFEAAGKGLFNKLRGLFNR